MVSISKEEAKLVREYFPNVHIVRTMKQKSSRHRYYCEENWKAMKFLERVHNGETPSQAIRPPKNTRRFNGNKNINT